MTRTERNVMWRTASWGVALTLFVIVLDQSDSLVALDRWLYDRRARDCQHDDAKDASHGPPHCLCELWIQLPGR